MSFFRKHKKISIVIIFVLVLFLIFGGTYARYVYNFFNNYILETKGFYFNSTVLSDNVKSYKFNNWDGVNSYTLTIDVNSKKNESVSTEADIKYNIEVDCSDNATCSVNKTSGIIYESQKMDSYQLMISPNDNFYENDEVIVRTTVMSTAPYRKKLAATFIVGVLKADFSYSIEDSVNSKFLTLNLVNSVGYYVVEEAFGSYSVGDQISIDTYNNLSDSEKAKCFSSKVTLTFPADKLELDMTSNSYLHRVLGSESFTKLNGYNYVSKYTFKLEASASEKILFYKKDLSKNYTYPIVTSSPIIDISVVGAE